MYGYPQPHVQPKVSGKIVQSRKELKPKTPNTRKRKTLNVCSFVTSSTSIGVPPVLTKSGNLVEFVHGVYKPHSMSRLYVEALKNHNVEPNVKSSSKVSVVAGNVVSDVTTSLVQSDQIKSKSESESASDNEKSQSKMVIVGDENDG